MQIGIIGYGTLGRALKIRIEKHFTNSKISVFTTQSEYFKFEDFYDYSKIENFNGIILVAVKGEKIFNAISYIEQKNNVYVFTKSLINGKFMMDYIDNTNFKYVRGLLFAKDIISKLYLDCSVYSSDTSVLNDNFLSKLNFRLQNTSNIRISELISIYKNPIAIYFAYNNIKGREKSKLILEKLCLIKEGSLPNKIAKSIIDDYEVCISSPESRNFMYGLNMKKNIQNKYIPEGILYYKDLIKILGSKIVLTYGTFDLLHYGHLRLLKRAKKNGDFLIVGLSSDKFNSIKSKKSSQNFKNRKEILQSIKFVDLIISEENWDQKLNDVKKYQVDNFVMGDDWKGKFDFLNDFCNVIYLQRTPNVSSTQLRKLKETK